MQEVDIITLKLFIEPGSGLALNLNKELQYTLNLFFSNLTSMFQQVLLGVVVSNDFLLEMNWFEKGKHKIFCLFHEQIHVGVP